MQALGSDMSSAEVLDLLERTAESSSSAEVATPIADDPASLQEQVHRLRFLFFDEKAAESHPA